MCLPTLRSVARRRARCSASSRSSILVKPALRGVQCSSQLRSNQQIDLCLDLAEASAQITVAANVIWSDPTARTGFSFSNLPDSAVRSLRQWLFLNAIAAAANAAARGTTPPKLSADTTPPPNYTDTLTAASAVQREADSLGTDLVAILSLVASRSPVDASKASGAALSRARRRRHRHHDLPRELRRKRSAGRRNS